MNSLERLTDTKQRISVGVTQENFDFASFVVHTHLAKAWGQDTAGYAIHRNLRFSVRTELQAVFDDLALNLGWRAQRIDARSLLLEAEGLLISATGTRKPDYCSCAFDIWAHEPRRAEAAGEVILTRVGDTLIRDPIISIDWNFLGAKSELHSRHVEEIADDVLHDEAYPDVEGGIANFVAGYLDAAETVLVLQGPPGTGKTRLIRGILGEMSRRDGGNAEVLYTGDKKALETDEIFVRFLTRDCDAFVIEDADHILQPRTKGNDHLHRFLTIADGLVRAEGRKIIFSTNLPNVGDLDDALIRPGRCFARVHMRELLPAEGEALLQVLCGSEINTASNALVQLGEPRRKTYPLAALYKAAARVMTRGLPTLEHAPVNTRPAEAELRKFHKTNVPPEANEGVAG